VAKVLYIFQGPPATGKSTKRDEIIASRPTLTVGYVNKDELREVFPEASEREIHHLQQNEMELFAHEGRDIIIDNTNLNPRTVAGYMAWAQRNGYEAELVTFGRDVPYAEAVERDRKRGEAGGRTVGRSVIYQFYVDAGLVPVSAVREQTDFGVLFPYAVLFDIDGTVADIEHRRHFVRTKPKDWKSFNAAMHLDTVRKDVRSLYQLYRGWNVPILFMSGRGAENRVVTERWLADNGFDGYEAVIMRGYGDSRPDDVIKRELFERYVEPYWRVMHIIDDRPSVIRMWRALGLAVIDVGKGEEF
jgi:predicted ABC-type ATPase